MARTPHAGGHGRQSLAVLDRPRAISQRAASRKPKKPYKILLEAVTQEKRKLQSILTYHDRAPEGFGYIPVGYPEITEWCKEQCRQRSLDVHIVSAKPKNKIHADPEKISHHVHRIGHHFPISIIELACAKFGYTFSIDTGLQKRSRATYGDAYFERGIADYQFRHSLHGAPPANGLESKEHISGAIREMFPKIPEADLNSIVNHAFQQGTNRVGNAKELSLARRVQLAVVAHIRHVYTEYDQILKNKTGSWNEARQKVESVSLAKLKEWRDEAGEANNELEETFREVIVLDDDDDKDVSDDETAHRGLRESSMEVFSSRATARDLQPEPIDLTRRHGPQVLRAPRRRPILLPMSPRTRQSLPPVSSIIYPSHAGADQRFRPPPTYVYGPEQARPRMYDSLHQPIESRPPIVPAPQPRQMRGANGRLYNLRPIEEPRTDDRIMRVETPARLVHSHPSNAPYYPVRDDRPPRLENRPSRPVLLPTARRASDQDLILPSVEREPLVHSETSLERRPRGDSISHFDARTPKRKSLPSSAYHSPREPHQEQPPKRQRPVSNIEYSQPLPNVNYGYQPTNPDSSPMRPSASGHRDVHAGAGGPSYVPTAAWGPPERIPAQPNSTVTFSGFAPPRQWPRPQSRRSDDEYSSRAVPRVEHGANHDHPGRVPYRSSRVESYRP